MLIVDEHTGRMLAGRRYNEGMHQAIEAKEGVEIKEENQTLATITLQNYFRLYEKLSGMTGTAMTEAAEFDKIYKLGVVPIPTNRPMVRASTRPTSSTGPRRPSSTPSSRTSPSGTQKGQPVLVGTVSVEKSEHLSAAAAQARRPARGAERQAARREAKIVAQAGRKGAVTVATNMAGRGTDIMLGGNAEFLADARAAQRRASTRSRRRGVRGRLARRRSSRSRSRSRPSTTRSRELGGLYVARHRAARVAPHRQPAARPLRPPGRPGRVPVLPVARGRPDAAVQVATGSTAC